MLTRRYEIQPFYTKLGSITKNLRKIAISTGVRLPKIDGKIRAAAGRPALPFRTKCGSSI